MAETEKVVRVDGQPTRGHQPPQTFQGLRQPGLPTMVHLGHWVLSHTGSPAGAVWAILPQGIGGFTGPTDKTREGLRGTQAG